MVNHIEFWSGTDLVFDCLLDKRRALAFRKAIFSSVKPGDIVVDLGTGTGIMAMFAVDAGAEKVFAVEADENLIKNLKITLKPYLESGKIELIRGDATTIKLPIKADVIICEMVATGLLDELQVPVMNNALSFAKADTDFIPLKIRNFAELVEKKEEFYGHAIEAIMYEYRWYKDIKSKPLSEKKLYKEVNFSNKNDPKINAKIPFSMKKTGKINGIRITNQTVFPDGSSIEDTNAYCIPLVIPFKSIEVQKNDLLELALKYEMCKGIQSLMYNLKLK